ncbi:MAG TPA: RDD family protein [Mycobacteriales bacterium]|nr:RDD family protein [Mycobacteriales bacterium]
MTQLVTGEAVVLDLRLAGVPSRVAASLVDIVVQGLALALLLLPLGAVVASSSPAVTAGAMIVLVLAVMLGYPVLMETLAGGRTLGKLVLGLRVVRDDGGPIGFRHAVTRGLLGLFVEKPGFTWGSAGLITALLNERGKRLGDLAAGTVVVQERVARQRADSVAMPPPLAGWASTLDLTGLPDDLAESARSYLGRLSSLTAASQGELGSRIASAVAAVVTPPPPAGVPPWAYLSAVLAERRRRGGYGVQVFPAAPPSLAGYSAPSPVTSPPAASAPPSAVPEGGSGSPFAPPG